MNEITFHVERQSPEITFTVKENEFPTQTKSVTPSETAQTVTPDAGFLLEEVDVAAIPEQYIVPDGKIEITQNGDDLDVAQYARAKVAVPQGVFPSGVRNITEDGDYDVTQYEGVHVATAPARGVLFSDYDNDGYPTKAEIKGIDPVPADFMAVSAQTTPKLFTKITSVKVSAASVRDRAFERLPVLETAVFTDSVSLLGYVVRYCNALKRVEFLGDVSLNYSLMGEKSIEEIIVGGNVTGWINPFNTNAAVTDYNVRLYDFSHCSDVFTLSSVYHLPHADNCVIRVPRAKLTEWQAATNWCDLTGVIWEGV